jgi:hypothetical protein
MTPQPPGNETIIDGVRMYVRTTTNASGEKEERQWFADLWDNKFKPAHNIKMKPETKNGKRYKGESTASKTNPNKW